MKMAASSKVKLTDAVIKGNLTSVKQLIKNGANIEERDEHGWTPLFHASERNHINIIEYLVKSGAKVNARCSKNSTPLMWAAFQNATGAIEVLLEVGAHINDVDYKKRTALFYSCNGHAYEAAKRLIDHGANVNQKAHHGFTPLMYASHFNALEVANLLIKRRANLDACDKDGLTALFHTTQSNSRSVAKLLIQKGARLDIKDKNNMTPISWASFHRAELVKTELVSAGVKDCGTVPVASTVQMGPQGPMGDAHMAYQNAVYPEPFTRGMVNGPNMNFMNATGQYPNYDPRMFYQYMPYQSAQPMFPGPANIPPSWVGAQNPNQIPTKTGQYIIPGTTPYQSQMPMWSSQPPAPDPHSAQGHREDRHTLSPQPIARSPSGAQGQFNELGAINSRIERTASPYGYAMSPQAFVPSPSAQGQFNEYLPRDLVRPIPTTTRSMDPNANPHGYAMPPQGFAPSPHSVQTHGSNFSPPGPASTYSAANTEGNMNDDLTTASEHTFVSPPAGVQGDVSDDLPSSSESGRSPNPGNAQGHFNEELPRALVQPFVNSPGHANGHFNENLPRALVQPFATSPSNAKRSQKVNDPKPTNESSFTGNNQQIEDRKGHNSDVPTHPAINQRVRVFLMRPKGATSRGNAPPASQAHSVHKITRAQVKKKTPNRNNTLDIRTLASISSDPAISAAMNERENATPNHYSYPRKISASSPTKALQRSMNSWSRSQPTLRLNFDSDLKNPLADLQKGLVEPIPPSLLQDLTDNSGLVLNDGEIPEIEDTEKWSKLMQMANINPEGTVRLLKTNCRDLNRALNEQKLSPLIVVVRENSPQAANVFIEAGADMEQRDIDGKTALMHATEVNSRAIVEVLGIKQKCNVNAGDNRECTALMMSSANDYSDITELLLKAGASCKQTDDFGLSAATYSAAANAPHSLSALLSSDADLVDLPDNRNATPLMWATRFGAKDSAKLLLESGADVSHKDINGQSVLHHLSLSDSPELAKLLAEKCDLSLLSSQDNDGFTPADYARSHNAQNTLRWLQEQEGGNGTKLNKQSGLPVSRSNPDIIQIQADIHASHDYEDDEYELDPPIDYDDDDEYEPRQAQNTQKRIKTELQSKVIDPEQLKYAQQQCQQIVTEKTQYFETVIQGQS